MKYGASGQKLSVYCFDSTTNLPLSGEAGNLTAYVSKDNGAVTALTDTSASEDHATNAKGFYTFDLSQLEVSAYKLKFTAKSTNADAVVLAIPAVVFTDSITLKLPSLPYLAGSTNSFGFTSLLSALVVGVTSQTEFYCNVAGFGDADGYLNGCSVIIHNLGVADGGTFFAVRNILSQIGNGGNMVLAIDEDPGFPMVDDGSIFISVFPPGSSLADSDKLDQLLVRLSLVRAALLDKLNVSGNVASSNELAQIISKLPSQPYLTGTDHSDGHLDFDDFGSVSEVMEDAFTNALDNAEIVFSIETLDAMRDHFLGGKLHLDSSVDTGTVPATAASFSGGSTLSPVDGFYSDANCNLVFTSGELQGLCNSVVGYTGSDKKLFFEPPWPVAPQDGDEFVFVGRID